MAPGSDASNEPASPSAALTEVNDDSPNSAEIS